MISLVLAHVLSILLAGGLRFGPSAVLAGAGSGPWLALVLLAAAGLILALRHDVRVGHAPWSRRGRLLLWLVFPGATALHWTLGRTEAAAGADLPWLMLILGLVIAVLSYRRAEWARRETDARAWRAGARVIGLPTILVVAAALAFGEGLHGAGVALLTYPLYALAQLAAALVLPWTQWERDGVPVGRRAPALALLFGLVHWPNPFAAAASGLGMLLWAWGWRAGSALLPLALSMGIMGAVVTQAMPEDLTAHMRVGANAVLKSRELERFRRLDAEAQRINVETGPLGPDGLRRWLGVALEPATGAPVDSALVDATADLLERMHREYTLRRFFDSEEFRSRNRIEDRLDANELRFFGSTFVPFHPAHAPYVALVERGATMPYREFIALAYRELLGRSPRDVEFRHWPYPVSVGTRYEFLRRVLEGGGLVDGDLRHWREPDDPELRRRLRETREARPR